MEISQLWYTSWSVSLILPYNQSSQNGQQFAGPRGFERSRHTESVIPGNWKSSAQAGIILAQALGEMSVMQLTKGGESTLMKPSRHAKGEN
jgi:hypothetical protein